MMILKIKRNKAGEDPEILERGGALCRPSWLADEEKNGLKWLK